MHISEFNYDLPSELIAQRPLVERDASRMLVLDRRSESYLDSDFKALEDYLSEGDVLVLNNTRVFPARLRGRRQSGGAIELLLLQEKEVHVWEALARPARKLKSGEKIFFADPQLRAAVVDSPDEGIRLIRFESTGPLDRIIDQIGEPPLPPYIKRKPKAHKEDRDRYQTVYASQRGAIAAPTAGLHFTPAVLEAIKARGVQVVEITLHVGHGTFAPVKVDDVYQHRVAAEWFSISNAAAQIINAARTRKRRIFAVGTTTARALESAANRERGVIGQSGSARLTILPGYEFRVVDALLTNFHLPRSSLLILVCSFADRQLILKAYRHAVRERYRFYSYGDCMLII